jgi:hypothetical protein
MAKSSRSISFKNAEIDTEADTITETTKDDMKVFSLSNLLKSWNKIDGLSISIRLDEDAPEDGE